ncbi:unnamed protein product [Polarella glacialis]|uniref:Endonuclease/exonuclease/phosphatase domain-containing protein n=1 Tax=Polarella glacialis TaxID=89957 RepID=A0A813KYH5_POLGL|nr:unnamed protein product [Polarella glacialis]
MAAGRVSGLLGAPLALQCVGQIWAAQGVTTSSPGSASQGRRLSTCAENSVSHPSKLRLVQYNVRGFTTPGGACGVDAISRSLHGLQPAIVCLNEVDVSKKPEGLRRLAESAGLPHIHFFGHVGGRYGNALLSRFPILRVSEVHLQGGTELEWPVGSGQTRRIKRGMLAATLAVTPTSTTGVSDQSPSTLTIVCTHLDHIDEAQRLVQMSHILEEMQSLPSPHILVGDLNALFADDYSPAEWAAVEQKAVENGWSLPCDAACLRLLLQKGYVDAFRQSSGGASEGPLPSGLQKFTAHTSRPMYRIDYALLSPSALEAGLHVESSFVDLSASGSDHFPLVVDVSWEAASHPAWHVPVGSGPGPSEGSGGEAAAVAAAASSRL